jgi:aconitate hydratase
METVTPLSAGATTVRESSREHAALAVRNLGARVVLAHSIARIHGENLVNYGVLPLLFVEPADLERLEKGTVLQLHGLRNWRHPARLRNRIRHRRPKRGAHQGAAPPVAAPDRRSARRRRHPLDAASHS